MPATNGTTRTTTTHTTTTREGADMNSTTTTTTTTTPRPAGHPDRGQYAGNVERSRRTYRRPEDDRLHALHVDGLTTSDVDALMYALHRDRAALFAEAQEAAENADAARANRSGKRLGRTAAQWDEQAADLTAQGAHRSHLIRRMGEAATAAGAR